MRQSIFLFALWLFLTPTAAAQTERTVIRGAQVVDGSGAAAFEADVAIRDGVILEVGRIEARPGDRPLSARGRVLAPGFIDLHSHSRRGLTTSARQARTQVSQGITTLVIGADGGAPFPPNSYRRRLSQPGTAVNVALMVGHGTLRRQVMGDDYKRKARSDEVAAMAAMVRQAMLQGAFGLSSGLEYDPGYYSDTAELIALAREAAAWGGFYMTHMRDEEEGFIAALEEAVEIGRQAGIAVQISHIKLGNRRVWGKTDQVFRVLRQALRQGIDIAADCYPYDAWASSLSILVPSRRFEDRSEISDAFEKIGGPANVIVTSYLKNRTYEFRNMEEIASSRSISAVDLFIEMMRAGGAGIVGRSMSNEDVFSFYRHPRVMVASDGGTDSRHPRMSGSFPRVLGRFVRDQGILSLQEAVRKMTSLPARRLGLNDRGLIRPGFRADLVLFDPRSVIDRSDFRNHDRLSQGVELVLVNGRAVWKEGDVTGELPGRMLMHRPPKADAYWEAADESGRR